MLDPLTEAKMAQPAILVCKRPPGSLATSLARPSIDAGCQAADAQDFRHQHEQRHGGQGEAVHAAPTDEAQAVQARRPPCSSR